MYLTDRNVIPIVWFVVSTNIFCLIRVSAEELFAVSAFTFKRIKISKITHFDRYHWSILLFTKSASTAMPVLLKKIRVLKIILPLLMNWENWWGKKGWDLWKIEVGLQKLRRKPKFFRPYLNYPKVKAFFSSSVFPIP